MKKLIYLIVTIAILGLIVPGCIPVVPPAEQDNLNTFTKSNGSEVWVDDDYCDVCPNGGHTWGTDAFATIQDGVDAVAVGGTVNIANGNYNATSSPFVRITKPLSLVGESRDGVIIDGSGTSTISWAKGIHVTANNVSIENLTVQNFGAVSYWGYGIVFRDYAHDKPEEGFVYYDGCMVENVYSQNNCYPMYAFCYTNLTICNCLIQNNLSDGMFIAKGSDNAVVTGNTVLNSGDHGIWVGGAGWCGPSCDNAIITDNYIDGAREGGISFVGSDGATISGNTITNAAGEGWSVGALSLKDGPSNVEAFNNTIYGNDGNWNGYNGTGHGIGIDGTPSNIYINCNKIYDNTGYGIYNYSGVPIDATHNWWGHATGPHDNSDDTATGGLYNLDGLGDAVSDYVDYRFWAYIPDFCDCGAKTIGYWKNHPDYVEGILDALRLLHDDIVVGTGKIVGTDVLAEDIFKKPHSKTYSMLAAQLLAAKLNVAQLSHFIPGYNSDCMSEEIEEADFILRLVDGHLYSERVEKDDKEYVNGVKDELDEFNKNEVCQVQIGDCPCECY